MSCPSSNSLWRIVVRIPIIALVVWFSVSPAIGQDPKDRCFVLCAPTLKIEPTFTWENLIRRPRVVETDSEGRTVTTKVERERVFETVIAADIPTTIPRVSFTFETIIKPLVKGTSP